MAGNYYKKGKIPLLARTGEKRNLHAMLRESKLNTMKTHQYFSLFAVVGTLLISIAPAHADLTLINRSAFSLPNVASDNYGFEDIVTNSAGFLSLPSLWTAHGVTYIAPGNNNLIIDQSLPPVDGQPSGALSKMYTNNQPDAPLMGAMIAGTYALFGFDLADLWGTADRVDIKLTTNLGEYSFLAQSVPNLPSLAFFGYSAGAGEFFEAFSITAPVGTYVAMDNMTLGTVTAPVPEPEIYAMMIAGLGFLGWAGKRRKQQVA